MSYEPDYYNCEHPDYYINHREEYYEDFSCQDLEDQFDQLFEVIWESPR